MKVFDVRLPKWKKEVWIALALAALMVAAIFLPLAFQGSGGEFSSLNVGERASCFSDWYQSTGNVTAAAISNPGKKLKQSSEDAVNDALNLLFQGETVYLNAEGREYLELQAEGGAMRFVHVWGFLTGNCSGSVDMAVDIDTGKILSLNTQIIPAYGITLPALNADSVLMWAEENYDFTLLVNAPGEDGMSGTASFEHKGSVVSISYSCTYDEEGYAAVSVCCI